MFAQAAGQGLHLLAGVNLEVLAHQGIAQLVQDALEGQTVLEGEKDRPLEAPRAHEPVRRLGRQGRLALTAKAVQDDDGAAGEGALQEQQFAGAPVEAVQGRGREVAAQAFLPPLRL